MIYMVVILMLLLLGMGLVLWQRPFIVKGLRMAYRSGRLGPDINEKEAFANRTIHCSNPCAWDRHPLYNQHQLSDARLAELESLRTTAFIVIQDGKLVFEKYWDPFYANVPINSFSVAKSIVSILIGIAIKDDLLQLDHTVGRYIHSFSKGEKRHITIRHLLTMSSGLSWRETEGGAFSDNAEAYYGEDLSAVIDRLRVKRPPGEVYRYASGNTQILGMILQHVYGMSISALTSDRLWGKIEAQYPAYWNLDRPDGMEKAFCCFYATPLDFARIGQLYLNNGEWKGTQILDSRYVSESLKPLPIYDIWTQKTNINYGLHWWLAKYGGQEYFYARGIRGQYIICNRTLNTVIVRMGHKRNPVERHTGHPPDLFDHINAGLEIIKSNPH